MLQACQLPNICVAPLSVTRRSRVVTHKQRGQRPSSGNSTKANSCLCDKLEARSWARSGRRRRPRTPRAFEWPPQGLGKLKGARSSRGPGEIKILQGRIPWQGQGTPRKRQRRCVKTNSAQLRGGASHHCKGGRGALCGHQDPSPLPYLNWSWAMRVDEAVPV